MLKKLLATSAIAALLLAQPCEAAITLANIGAHNQPLSGTNILTTLTNACPVGSLIVLQSAQTTAADTLTSVVDSAGNTWQTPFDNIAGTGIASAWAYAVNTGSNLPVGGTITATYSGSTVSSLQATCVQGIATSSPLDASNHTAQGTAATSATSVATGTLVNASEIVMGTLATVAGAGTVTCGGAYTKISSGFSTAAISLCYQVVSATTSVAFAPTWVTSNNYVTDLISFQAPGGGAALVPSNLTTMGVSP